MPKYKVNAAIDKIQSLVKVPYRDRDDTWRQIMREALTDLTAEDPGPTLGEMAEVLAEWKIRGVTLDSVLYVAREKVYWDEVEDA